MSRRSRRPVPDRFGALVADAVAFKRSEELIRKSRLEAAPAPAMRNDPAPPRRFPPRRFRPAVVAQSFVLLFLCFCAVTAVWWLQGILAGDVSRLNDSFRRPAAARAGASP